MEYKYSTILTVLFVTMMYSSGMPILYAIACLFFLTNYWTEKVLFFYFYRKPENLDENLAKRTLAWFKYALLAHMVMGLLMFSNVKILPPKKIQGLISKFGKSLNSYTGGQTFKDLATPHMAIYWAVFMLIILSYCVWRYFFA